MHDMYCHLYLDDLSHQKDVDIVIGYNSKISQWLGTGYTDRVYQFHLTNKRPADLGRKNMKCSILVTGSCCVTLSPYGAFVERCVCIKLYSRCQL